MRYVSTANSQTGQASVITDVIKALWRVSLILALKSSLLNREWILKKYSEGLGFSHFYVHSPCDS
jgi:hypothetical protein